jgi:alkaline phosphatase D
MYKNKTGLFYPLSLLFILAGFNFLNAQIQSGPMLGYPGMLEAKVWIQTEYAANVQIRYWDTELADEKYITESIQTSAQKAFTATCIADKVLPGKTYNYEVWVDGKKMDFAYPLKFTTMEIWKWRKDAPDFKFAFGSCFYVNEPEFDRPGKPYGQNFQILNQIESTDADFMIWGGDNMYYRETDWNTKTGLFHRFTHTRALDSLQPLLAKMPHFAIWDDHDYGPNDSDRSYWMKHDALEVFKSFWANPNYIFPNDGITGTFTWSDCQFFLLDDRWWRSPNNREQTGNRDYFGNEQIEWLIDALSGSEATFKFIVSGGQIINPVQVSENYSNYAEERTLLLKLIEQEGIKGVIFLTGDRHHTCLQKLDRPGNYPLYDLTVSPLTSGAGKPSKMESNALFVEGTIVTEKQNFATLDIKGGAKERQLDIKVFNSDGSLLWEKTILQNELGW